MLRGPQSHGLQETTGAETFLGGLQLSGDRSVVLHVHGGNYVSVECVVFPGQRRFSVATEEKNVLYIVRGKKLLSN